MSKKTTKRKKWTKKEDQLLTATIKTLGAEDWKLVQKKMEDKGIKKTLKQLKVRWTNQISPSLKKDKWSEEESERLFDSYLIYGNKWKRFAEEYEGRSDNCVKNRFFSMIRKAMRTAIKLANKDKEESSTIMMNTIKPKMLIDFVSTTFQLKDGAKFNGGNELKVLEFVKVYRKRENGQFENPVDENEKRVIEQTIKKLDDIKKAYEIEGGKDKKNDEQEVVVQLRQGGEETIIKELNNLNKEDFVCLRIKVGDFLELRKDLDRTKLVSRVSFKEGECCRQAADQIDRFKAINNKTLGLLNPINLLQENEKGRQQIPMEIKGLPVESRENKEGFYPFVDNNSNNFNLLKKNVSDGSFHFSNGLKNHSQSFFKNQQANIQLSIFNSNNMSMGKQEDFMFIDYKEREKLNKNRERFTKTKNKTFGAAFNTKGLFEKE